MDPDWLIVWCSLSWRATWSAWVDPTSCRQTIRGSPGVARSPGGAVHVMLDNLGPSTPGLQHGLSETALARRGFDRRPHTRRAVTSYLLAPARARRATRLCPGRWSCIITAALPGRWRRRSAMARAGFLQHHPRAASISDLRALGRSHLQPPAGVSIAIPAWWSIKAASAARRFLPCIRVGCRSGVLCRSGQWQMLTRCYSSVGYFRNGYSCRRR